LGRYTGVNGRRKEDGCKRQYVCDEHTSRTFRTLVEDVGGKENWYGIWRRAQSLYKPNGFGNHMYINEAKRPTGLCRRKHGEEEAHQYCGHVAGGFCAESRSGESCKSNQSQTIQGRWLLSKVRKWATLTNGPLYLFLLNEGT